MKQQVIKCLNLKDDVQAIVSSIEHDKLFVLTDTHCKQHCLPLIADIPVLREADVICVKAGDQYKNIESLTEVWQSLSVNGATRHSLLINLGGGMVTDLGGFAAATFKRGMKFVNIPTTLLGAVDAAVGGKTGINFGGLKNEVGSFASAEAVMIDTVFFKTLDRANLLAGYAEMLKHSLLKDVEEWKRTVAFDFEQINYELLKDLLIASVKIKEQVVEKDPFEKNIRKALNLGHTVGHAFESLSYETDRPVPHGYAVAWGLVCELYLSFRFCGFAQDKLLRTVRFIKEHYPCFSYDCTKYDRLFELMRHDKKNEGTEVNFTLLEDIGEIKINQTLQREDIYESLDFCRESFGL